ncbi:hypothetical protein NNO_0466 [Hydrogenimonas sp.]|nr:hypothetical protein NNO_0466 [Hydrogenimonas sp.]
MKNVVRLWLFLVIIPLVLLAALNYYIDPLWCFSHSNSLNNRQDGFNERQQKTNRAYFTQMLRNSDSILLGSSRTAYINQFDFKGMRLYNYATDNMVPKEYERWIEIAKRIKGGSFRNIVIGIDFFGTAENYDAVVDRYYNHKKPEDYFAQTIEPLYRYKMLLTWDSTKHSIRDIKRVYNPTVSDYDRNNVRHVSIKVSPKQLEKNIERDIDEYLIPMTKEYRYRSDWPLLLENLKKRNPESSFILFTTPVSMPFFKKFVVEAGHIDEYFRWLNETVSVFGRVYHFMDINSVTSDLKNFFDAHHVYADVDRMIAQRISGYGHENIPKDFGVLLTKENIDEYEKAMRRKLSGNLLKSSQN